MPPAGTPGPAPNQARLSRKKLGEQFAARVRELGLGEFSHDPKYDDHLIRARQPHPPLGALARLATVQDEAVRMAVLMHPQTKAKVLWRAIRNEKYGPRSAVLKLAAMHPNSDHLTLEAVVNISVEPAASLAAEALVLRRLRDIRRGLGRVAALALGGGALAVVIAVFAESDVTGQVAFFGLAASCFLYWMAQAIGLSSEDRLAFALKSALLVPAGGVLLWLGFTPQYGIPVLDAVGRVLWFVLDAL